MEGTNGKKVGKTYRKKQKNRGNTRTNGIFPALLTPGPAPAIHPDRLAMMGKVGGRRRRPSDSRSPGRGRSPPLQSDNDSVELTKEKMAEMALQVAKEEAALFGSGNLRRSGGKKRKRKKKHRH
eukprot:910674_1